MRWSRFIFKVAGIFFLVLVVLWMGIAVFLQLNKDRIFKTVTSRLNAAIEGTLVIGGIEPSFTRGFPNISVHLSNVALRDTLWSTHHKDLLNVRDVYVTVDLLSVLYSKTRIRDVHIENGSINLFTDSLGRSNTSALAMGRKNKSTKDAPLPSVQHVYFHNVNIAIRHIAHFKDFQFSVREMDAALDYTSSGWDATIYIAMQVQNMMFNTTRGSFLKDKFVRTKLSATYNKAYKEITIPRQRIRFDDDVLRIGGKFMLAAKPASFMLEINAHRMRYSNVLSCLSWPISSKLERFNFTEPIDVQALLRGHIKYRDTPYVVVSWQINDNTLHTSAGDIEHCTFTGIYNNEHIRDAGHRDENALVQLKGMHGVWRGIPFRADTVSITNLTRPILEGRFRAAFDVSRLNALTGASSFHFDTGKVNVDVLYKGGVFHSDTSDQYMYGSLSISNAALTYVPRGITFTQASAVARFAGSDLFIENTHLRVGSTRLDMQAQLRNFLNLYYIAPEKIIWDWSINIPVVNIADFTPLLAPRKTGQPEKKARGAQAITRQLNKFLDESRVHMNVHAGKVVHRQFVATDLGGQLYMVGDTIGLRHFSIHHAGGTAGLDATIVQNGKINNYDLDAHIDQVNVQKFFAAFENFGQDAITDENVRGTLTAGFQVTGAFYDNATPVPRSINGVTHFRFTNGTLLHFPPFRSLGKFIFRNRNLDSIAIHDIDTRFTISGDKIEIHPILIESSAINIHMQGIYALSGSGTDLKLDVPLRNPKKDELIIDEAMRRKRSMKGIVLHLRAMEDNDGKVKLRWNDNWRQERDARRSEEEEEN